MKAVFLDYATVSPDGDLDTSRLTRCLPSVDLRMQSGQDEVGHLIAGCDVVLLNKLQMTADLIESAPGLRLISVSATGTNNIDLSAAERAGVAVCNVRDYCTASVTEHVIGTLLLLTHRLREYDRRVRSGAWQAGGQFCLLDFPIRELAGLTIGIVGHGTLGTTVARAAEALGMRVLIANRPASDAAPGRIDLHEMLGRLDVLSLHCPLTPATTGLIGEPEIRLMKPDAILINTARGGLVASDALANALREGRLGGASIDVLPEEPPVSGDPLLADDIPNLIVTPHIAWASREARQRCLNEMAANVDDFLRGGRRGRVV
jgi:glycerate dehydrogenase